MDRKNCPNCNAAMVYLPGEGIYRCDYCGSRFAANEAVERQLFERSQAEAEHQRALELERARTARAEEERRLEAERRARAAKPQTIIYREPKAPRRGCGGPVRITLSVIAIIWLSGVLMLTFGVGNTGSLTANLFLTFLLAGPPIVFLIVSVIMTFTRKR